MTKLVLEQPVEAAPLPNSSRASIIALAAVLMLLFLPGRWKLLAIPVLLMDLSYQVGNEGIK